MVGIEQGPASAAGAGTSCASVDASPQATIANRHAQRIVDRDRRDDGANSAHALSNPLEIVIRWSPWHIPCTVHSSFPVFATIFFGERLTKRRRTASVWNDLSRAAQNADDNDGGGFSRHAAWYGFDELTRTAGSRGKSYKRGLGRSEREFESNRMMGNRV